MDFSVIIIIIVVVLPVKGLDIMYLDGIPVDGTFPYQLHKNGIYENSREVSRRIRKLG